METAQKVTPQQAINLLDSACQPAVLPKLTRTDMVNVQVALEVLQAFVTANEPKDPPKPAPETGGAFGKPKK